MSEYLGKLHETAVRFPDTDIWMDTCGEMELDYGLERGIVGATSNPIIIGAVIKDELPKLEGKIKELIQDMPEATEEDITWALIDYVGADRSKKLLPVYEQFKGKKGRLSIQTNAKYYRNTELMVAQAMHLNSLGKNMQIKIPASAAGIKAMEEVTYRGASVNATVSFTVAQAVAVAEAVERGLNRRKAEGLPVDDMSPVCTLMIGRVDDWVKQSVAQSGKAAELPEALEWCGVAVMKEAYRIYKEKGFTTRLLSAAYRNLNHWSELVGGDLCMTIPYKWHVMINACERPVEDRINVPVKAEYMDALMKLPEFVKSFDANAQTPEEFVSYGGFQDTLATFIGGYEQLLGLIRNYMIYPEKH
ncbi:transaldolase family protein [Anaerolentibacter hominis]|uniref:transaldolase family protein n=1 Tax=Anaerolentibacter hominis TaxID=3079009 RepID=UPI0031B809BB